MPTLGAVAVVGALRLKRPRPPAPAQPPFDAVGFVGLAAGIGLAVFGDGWMNPAVWPAWAGGGALLVGYGLWARRRDGAILSLGLVGSSGAVAWVVLLAMVSVAISGVIFLVPTFLQTAGGHTALTAGVAMAPQAILMGVGMWAGMKLTARVGLATTVGGGVVVLGLSTAALLLLSASSPVWVFAAVLAGRGVAVGLVVQPVLSALLGPVPADRLPDATTLFNVVEQVAGTFGMSLIVTLFAVREAAQVSAAVRAHGTAPAVRAAQAQGLHDVVWVLVAVCAASLILALLPRRLWTAARSEVSPG
jgi:hypothetical protein